MDTVPLEDVSLGGSDPEGHCCSFSICEMRLMSLLSEKSGDEGWSAEAPGFPGGTVVKNPPANAGDTGSIPGSRRSPGGGTGYPLQYCLGYLMDRRAW